MALGRRSRRNISAAWIVASAVAAATFVKVFIGDLILVRGVSMSPTIRPDSVALVSRCAYGIRLPFSSGYLARWAEPAPGEIVLVGLLAEGPRRAVKRVFEAGPAYMRAEAGVLSGRGGSVALGPVSSARLAGSTYVPAGRAFLVGDNGGESFDSRDYGSVPIETILGKVLLYSGGPARATEKTDNPKDAADDVDR
ncbi:MAG: signal peptidase I [Spirochaetes bacterium]|nr:signal peptidase I [Spirochaetota bacterium]MBU1080349.1 signal peptidase I [Spirochaetota bacterium]